MINKKNGKYFNLFPSGKKGQIFHWIAFGVLFAVAVFMVSSKSFVVSQKLVGGWHVNFLEKVYTEAEIDLLGVDQEARDSGWDTALRLAESGGFLQDSECGKISGRNVWNKGDTWCIPIVRDQAKLLIESKIPQKNIKFDGVIMKGDGEKKSLDISGDYRQKYDYSSSFAVNLRYNFGEYSQIEVEARGLVKKCKDESDVVKCVQENKEDHWKYCGSDTDVFCVNSPNGYKIRGNLVVYQFGLDFGGGLLVS